MDELPKEQKQVIAQVMLDLDYSASKIAEELKIHRSTVYRYGEKELPEDLRQFETEIKVLFAVKQQQILVTILKKIEEAVNEEYRLTPLLSAFQIIQKHTRSLYDLYRKEKRRSYFPGI